MEPLLPCRLSLLFRNFEIFPPPQIKKGPSLYTVCIGVVIYPCRHSTSF